MQASTQSRARPRQAARSGSSAPRNAPASANRRHAWRWLLLIGAVVFAAGAIGDLVFHTLPADLTWAVEPLVGSDGYRAHLVTFAGMALVVGGLVLRGARR